MFNSLISFENDKSLGNDEIKDTVMKLLNESKQLKHICASQQQAIIKLFEKLIKIKDIFLIGDLFHC